MDRYVTGTTVVLVWGGFNTILVSILAGFTASGFVGGAGPAGFPPEQPAPGESAAREPDEQGRSNFLAEGPGRGGRADADRDAGTDRRAASGRS